ncbi:FKBP-type peptidyl-prolyl cis-trans isomerase [Novosphingobium cyanobacteriorum]|uniref:Peptidyl-prolyl cis-trans isomerase n=1 Tax=Novosphingobium cyanobacteriorum TaxID=3024215 RepID=A0ABT6CFA4_9SPHN|nr:FKBP-type peptidyl-prolyl cis-trans isomerase [Novosphingobium cyanobacteriorum]MDF8332601.1 FKBP-type peptidyl-prolyl cis-trans isomerase [Novosphingobium cyanobacteriorum]
MADLLQVSALAERKAGDYAQGMTQTLRIAAALATALVSNSALAQAPAPAPAPAAGAVIALPLQPMVGADKRTCNAQTASGLGYTVLKDATGPKAAKGDFVLVNYIGYLAANGQVFDQNMTTPFQSDSVIPGFSEGLGMMPRGSIYRLCIPAALGYGAKGAGDGIPANADLVFQVELLDSKTEAEVAAMRSQAQQGGAPQQ